MKNIIALSLSVGVVLGASGPAVFGQGPTGPATTIAAPTGRAVGKVAVLDNDRTLTGEVERIGDQVRVKRLAGETWLPAAKVVHICASIPDAYAFLRERSNLADPDERFRLVEWCRQHAMNDQALADAREALKLKPDDSRFRRMVAHLEEAANKPAVAAVAVKESVAPRAEVSAESLNLFATRVHPILMNACFKCHTAGRGGHFQLVQISGPAMNSRRSLEKNLAAVVAQFGSQDPTGSKFLTKAVSLHGADMTATPLKSRQAAAYKSLEQWVSQTTPNLPATAEAAAALPSPTTRADAGTWGNDRAAPTTVPPLPVRPTASGEPPAEKPSPSGPPNPVDPEAYNKEFHGGKKGS